MTIDEITKKRVSLFAVQRGIVYQDDNYLEFGYFEPPIGATKTMYENRFYFDLRKNTDEFEFFSKEEGIKMKAVKMCEEVEEHMNVCGNGNYPYTIQREYEAEKHIKLFNEKFKEIKNPEQFDFADELKYSFGIEFETASGYLPEDKCYELGLIPLRDGSISGVEYSTIPMRDNEGLNLLKAQMNALKKYTYTNKECSVHIHLGGYPVTPKAIYILYKLWWYTQFNILPIIPDNSYYTGAYKRNGKDYCKEIPNVYDFNELYEYFVGQKYLGDLYQPHPADIAKEAKWNIKTRYYNCNFINMLCYDSAKTVEFRFLTPTYSFEKLSTFLMILNSVLLKAEQLYKKLGSLPYNKINETLESMYIKSELSLRSILDSVYNKNTVDVLQERIKRLTWVVKNQLYVGDKCGSRLDIENRFFPDGKQED